MSDETRKQDDVYEIFAVRDQTGKKLGTRVEGNG
jgi:hypothetical protein